MLFRLANAFAITLVAEPGWATQNIIRAPRRTPRGAWDLRSVRGFNSGLSTSTHRRNAESEQFLDH
jgi:hypothetical protein